MTSSISGSSSAESQSNANLFNQWPYERLAEFVAATTKANKILQAETDMFQQYVIKHDVDKYKPGDTNNTTWKSTPSEQNAAKKINSVEGSIHKTSSRSSRSYMRSTPHQFEKLLKLRPEYKCDIVLKEMERLQALRAKSTEESERVVDHLKALIEEGTENIACMRRESYEFERDIVKGAVNPKSGVLMGEKVVRFFEEKMKGRANLISKLRLKNQSLRQQNMKSKQMLKHKEEIGDILTEIDFQRLKIENAEQIEKIENRNKEFFRLKTNGTSTMHTLNIHKKRLYGITAESNQLKQDIASRKSMLLRIDMETNLCEAERAKAEAINRKYRSHMAQFKVPEVMDVVYLHSNMASLKKYVRIWERKNQIAEMGLIAQKQRWAKIKVEAAETEDPLADILGI